MTMTETQLGRKMGIIADPVANKVDVDSHTLNVMLRVFEMNRVQRDQLGGTANPDLWCEFLPWHSLN